MITFEVEYEERRIRIEFCHHLSDGETRDILGGVSYRSGLGGRIWIRSEDPIGFVRFHGTLAHEAVHLAGHIAKDSGLSLDPQDEDVPELAALIVEGTLEGIEREREEGAADARRYAICSRPLDEEERAEMEAWMAELAAARGGEDDDREPGF